VARPQFLSAWITQPESCALVKLTRGGVVFGFGVIRRCVSGHTIGPLFADTPAFAEEIFQGLSATGAGETVYLDTPESNPAAVTLAELHAMKPVFGTARMYTRQTLHFPSTPSLA
jgi:hypothetical protein